MEHKKRGLALLLALTLPLLCGGVLEPQEAWQEA